MSIIEVYDPPMCCTTGICGLNVDPILVQFAADLKWLSDQKVTVSRFNLAQQPDKFVGCEPVQQSMALAGDVCLPLILVNGSIVFRHTYPSRHQLAKAVGIATE